MAAPVPAPLTVTIGESVFALRERAPALVRPDRMVDNGAVLVTRLAELTVVVDKRALALPPTRFAAIDQVAGIVTGVKLAPMANYARLQPTYALTKWLIGRAEASGWTMIDRQGIDPDALTADAAKPGRLPIRKTCAVLERGSATLRIVLEESRTPAADMIPRSPEPLFLVHTDFTDKALVEARLKPLFARRKEMTGGTRSLPLSAWAVR